MTKPKATQSEASRRAAGRARILVRLSAAEHEWCRTCAEACGLSLVAWARQVLRGEFAAKRMPT